MLACGDELPSIRQAAQQYDSTVTTIGRAWPRQRPASAARGSGACGSPAGRSAPGHGCCWTGWPTQESRPLRHRTRRGLPPGSRYDHRRGPSRRRAGAVHRLGWPAARIPAGAGPGRGQGTPPS